MLNTLTSDSVADDLSDHPGNPWLELNFEEPGLHLTDQGLEMTSAWSFPVGSTLSVGISCPAQPASAGDPFAQEGEDLAAELELALLEEEPMDAEAESAAVEANASATSGSGSGKAAVHATGVVISCIPSKEEEGNYQLTIYFLDHLANLMMLEEQENGDFVDEPSAAGLLPPGPQTLAPGQTIHGPAGNFFSVGVLPFFLGA